MLEEDLPEGFKGAPKLKEKKYVKRQKTILEGTLLCLKILTFMSSVCITLGFSIRRLSRSRERHKLLRSTTSRLDDGATL